jgi:serine/threonine-protein kinase RsbW
MQNPVVERDPSMEQINNDEIFRFDIPAAFKFLNVISSSIKAIIEQIEVIAERDIVTHNVVLAVHEICANIVEHAYAEKKGRIEIFVDLAMEPGRIIIDLIDKGKPFDINSVPLPDLDNAPVRGYGLFLARELMDEVIYQPGIPSGKNSNLWRLKKTLM